MISVAAEQTTWPEQGRLFPSGQPHVLGSGPQRRGSVPAARGETTLARIGSDVVRWIRVPGGRLGSGETIADLWWAMTPLLHSVGHSRVGLPVTGIEQGEAARLAHGVGGRLPSSVEWGWMAGSGQRLYPWGEEEPTSEHANLRGLGPGAPTSPWNRSAGATPAGIMDVAGNVWEWTSTTVPGDGAVIRGGSYNSLTLYAQSAYETEAPMCLRSAGLGVRPVREVTTCW